jgi:polyhydroxybutyrate depolymerase
VVYPNGTGPANQLSWNAGDCCGYASQSSVDEMAFIRGILAEVGALATIDPARIYATGFSNGGFLSYRIACEMADTFAAVAPVGGVLRFPACEPANPISLIHFHGLSDNVVPYDSGGKAGLELFATLDGCTDSTTVEVNPVTAHTIYTSCQEGTAVELYTVEPMGHMWPSQYILPASQIMWEFFKAHPMK